MNTSHLTSGQPLVCETPERRVARIYGAAGGPLLGWLEDEAQLRKHSAEDFAHEIGLTCSDMDELRSGTRTADGLDRTVLQSCARYLGVPAIVVKLLAGIIDIRDFAFPGETAEQKAERALRNLLDDPKVRQALPVGLEALSFEAKQAIGLLHAQCDGHGELQARQLPAMLRWLQGAAMEHNESELQAHHGASVPGMSGH